MHVAIKELSEMLLVQRHSAAGWTKASGAKPGNQGVDDCSGNQITELHSCCGPGHHRQDLGTLYKRKLDQI